MRAELGGGPLGSGGADSEPAAAVAKAAAYPGMPGGGPGGGGGM
jgi:hypothetical protein